MKGEAQKSEKNVSGNGYQKKKSSLKNHSQRNNAGTNLPRIVEEEKVPNQ
jgi:hypothetical protein